MNRTDLLLIIAVLVVALALGATIFFIFQAREERVVQSSREVLQEIDHQLQQGYMTQAADTIERLAGSDVSAATYLMLLKRTDILREQTGSWDLFRDVARQGHRSYRGRDDLYALYVYALLRSGRQEKAVELTGERKIEGERWQSLREEINLYVGDAAVEEDRPSKSREELYEILQSESPEVFYRLYRRTANTGFLLDALLLHAEQGQITRSWELLSREPSLMQQHPQLAFFLAVDAGKPAEARKLLENNPQIFAEEERMLLRADLALRLDELSTAEDVCRRLITDYPDASWIPYHNAAYISLERGRTPDSSILQPETDFGGERGAYLLHLAQLLIAYDRIGAAQRVLKEGEKMSKDSPEYQLVKEKTRSTVNPERYKALLRMLVNRDGGERYATHLAWFYLGIEDYAGLEELLEYYRSRYGDPPWLVFYRGVLAYERGRYGEAAQSFTASVRERSLWEGYYDAALAHARAGNISKALSVLEKARLTCGGEEHCDAVHFTAADIHIRNGDYQKARSALEKGFQIDPHDIDGQLLEKILTEHME